MNEELTSQQTEKNTPEDPSTIEQAETTNSPSSGGSEAQSEPTTQEAPDEGHTTWEAPSNMEDALKAIADLQLKLREQEAARMAAEGKALRLQADFDNFRKRKTKELGDSIRFANADLLLQLLPVLDNFDRALAAMEKTDNLTAVKDGVKMVEKSMKSTLQKIGLEPIHSVGKPFDPEVHEAITTIPVEEEEKKSQVIDEVEKGYKLRERVLRVAKVIIGE